jgi:hypothetical protein
MQKFKISLQQLFFFHFVLIRLPIVGYLTMYILGYCLPWRLTTFPGMFIPLITIALMYFLPETPLWLLKK